MHTLGSTRYQRVPRGQVIAVVKQPIGAGLGQPTRLFPDGGKVNVAAVRNLLKTVRIDFAEAAMAV